MIPGGFKEITGETTSTVPITGATEVTGGMNIIIIINKSVIIIIIIIIIKIITIK